MPVPDEAAAAAEFDRWAAAGRDASMARGHLHAALAVTADWAPGPQDAVLDVGCGNGWAGRMIVARGAGLGVGVDISPEMITRARAVEEGNAKMAYLVAPASRLPFHDESFDFILNVESLYYYPDPAAALAEWARLARPGARLGLVLDLYAESPGSLAWVDALDVGVHVLSIADVLRLVADAGFVEAWWRQTRPPGPPPDPDRFQPSRFVPSFAHAAALYEAGSLIVGARRG